MAMMIIPRCDGCGKEAHRTTSNDSVPLKRCSRCRQAFYHNASCQKMHYRQHRKACRLAHHQSDFVIRELPGRGKGVVAVRSLQPFESLCTTTTDNSSLVAPMVLPVLHHQCRRERCVVCFRRADAATAATVLWDNPICPVLVCSLACRKVGDANWLLSEELQCLQDLYSTRGAPPKLLPTALLLFRLLMAISRGKLSREQVLRMQGHDIPLLGDAELHQQAVGMTVTALLARAKQPVQLSSDVVRFLQRIKYNAFTIVDKDNTPLGFSLYHSPAHCFNHSCQPNAVQTYVFGDSSGPPCLQIGASSRPIAMGEEICIQYQVGGQLRDERRKFLHEQYNFWCECELCRLDTVQESILL
jgi:hypothetical protein